MKNTKIEKTLWTPARLASTILVLSLVAVFGASSCSSGDESRTNPSAPSAPTNSGPAPASSAAPRSKSVPPSRSALITLPVSVTEAEMKAVSGAPIKLSKYAGKAMIINLWATWCGPCRLEVPELVKLHKEFRAQGLEVIGLSTESPEESSDKVKRFVQDFDVSYRIGWVTYDVVVTLMQGTDSIPQSFVIGRDGRVIKRFVGFNPTTTPPQIRLAVEEALNAKAAD